MNKIIIFLTFTLLLSGCKPVSPAVRGLPQKLDNQASTSPAVTVPVKDKEPENKTPEITKPAATTPVAQVPPPVKVETSGFLNHHVLFAPQAPFGVWDELHEEACEEASMIMAVNYFQNKPLDNHIMEQGLLNLIKWEGENGYQVDVDANEVVAILGTYFKQSAHLLLDISVETIIAELDKGNLIIVPAAGRNLGNPYFTAPGPLYHMLLLKGYDKKTGEFITNDPGTKRGENYRYTYSRLLNAIADWDHNLASDGMTQEEIEQGRRVLIVATP